MTALPDPLVPAEVDLQDFAFMPLQVARLRDSDFAATVHPEAGWYGVLLWAASWHQIPAGSLPDNDVALMRLVGLGRDARTWKKHKEEALYGFIRCKDGRLYHPTVAEQANQAWAQKVQQRHRAFCAAVRKHNERNADNKLQIPSFEQWEELGKPERVAPLVTVLSHVTSGGVPRDNGSKRQGQGQGEGQGESIDTPNGVLSAASADQTAPQLFELEVQGDEPDKPEPLTPDDLVETWNDMAPRFGLPVVKGRLSEARRRQARARLRDHPDPEDWKAAFRCIASTPFLQGDNDRGWRADFDFLLQPKSFTKLIEGSYGKN